jgi:hypothetical protein
VNDAARMRHLLLDALAVNTLGQVLELARRVGVVAAPVKGVVLARWIYGSLEERPYRDLDLLVGRAGLAPMTAAIRERGWPIRLLSLEMGALEFQVGRLEVELHAEFGRRDLTRLSTDDVLARAVPDRATFPFEVLRIDDVDHFLLLVANVTKDAYTYANPHQPRDLELLLGRLEPRWGELATRARTASCSTALRTVSAWMADEHGSPLFARFLRELPPGPRRLLPAVVRLHRRFDRKQESRLGSASALVGLALATLTVDDWRLRGRGLARVVRRGISRRAGRDPG